MSRMISRIAPTKKNTSTQRRLSKRSSDLIRRRFLTMENLEGRSLLATLVADVMTGTASTTIGGTVYEDLNSNGIKDNGENGVKNWTVFLDLDKSGTLNADANGAMEPSVITNVDGDYLLKGMIPGSYRVGQVVQTGWTPTSPESQDVTAVKDKDTKLVNFFNFSGGDIVGTVWNDLNRDGVRAVDASGAYTEPGLSGWTMFLDLNNEGALDPAEPSTLTDADGRYSFSSLPPGDYEVTEIKPAGWDVSPGKFDIKQTAAVKARQQFTQDFANFSLTNGSIDGTIWNDTNANGIRETDPATGEFTEPGLADWTVFLDTNNNRIADPDETTTLTDANGHYSFISLPARDYEVTEVVPAGWNISPTYDSRQTVRVSGGTATTARDFANFTILNGSISGTVWNDVNRNGVRDVSTLTGATTDPGLANWTMFLDLNRNRIADAGEPSTLTDANGQYVFPDLQVGDYQVQEVIPTGWEVATTFSDSQTVTVRSGVDSIAPDFANFNLSAASPGSVSGVVWNDLNGNGVRDLATTGGYSDPGLSGWTVFVDLNADKLASVGEPQAVTGADGSYSLSGVLPGSVSILVQPTVGWKGTAPITNMRTIALKSGENAVGLDFGEAQLKDSSISGVVFSDSNKDGVRATGERGLAGITVYLDLNDNGLLDPTEPQVATSADLFYTPDVDEAGSYSFTHLAKGTYTVREVIPAILGSTPVAESVHTVTITAAEDRTGVNSAAVFRPSEIHGTKFDDANGNHVRDAGEAGVGGATIFVDMNRNNVLDAGEPTTTTLADGSYTFANMTAGAYVIREVVSAGYSQTSPTTLGGILWPAGTSNAAVGNVGPTSITKSLAIGESYRQNVSLTLPNTGALTNLVDVFLLFDDTGSFTNNSPIVRSAFPDIISKLQTSLPGIDLGFGVGRLEEYGNFAYEYATGRPFILNQPVVAASSAGYMTAIQAALNRTTPGYGGDQPETDIEALYQLVTGKGFDGNNNGTTSDSGAAGLASTQLNPGSSGDVPSFASFTADPANSVMSAAGNVGGAGFRSGALPIVLLATDTGFAYQPKGETSITGVGGVSLPISSFTQTSRPTTPFNNGAGIQETITGLNALGALVIGLGTNPDATIDPRQGLEAISKLTGATNQSTATIANGTANPIAPGDPLYFQIASGFGASVANGVVSAIQNAVTNVAVDMELRASDPRVRIINHTGILHSVRAGSTANFDVEFIGDGVPHRFDLQFVRAGTNVVLGSIPVVLGTPVPGDGYEFEDLEDGAIGTGVDFGDHYTGLTVASNIAPSFVAGGNQTVLEDAGIQTVAAWATSISAGESGQVVNFFVSNDKASLFSAPPSIASDGTLIFTPAPNAFGTATVTVQAHDNGGTANGGVDTSSPQSFTITIESVNDAPVANNDSYTTAENAPLTIPASGVLSNDTDVEGDALSSIVVSAPSHGTLVLAANGSFTYTPDLNYNGTDSFSYKANDGAADSNVATVNLTITPVNNAPVATADTYTTAEDVTLVVPAVGVLANDFDVDGDALSVLLVSGPSHGLLTLGTDGSFIYTPDASYNGTDSFSYKANDGLLDSSVVEVKLTVTPVNDAPVAVADNFVTAEDVPLTVAASGVLVNDWDIEGDVLSAILVSGPAHGTITLNADGSFTYTPDANYNGADSFSYKANDDLLDSNVVEVSLTITPVNDAPVAVADNYSTAEDVTLVVPATGVLANDSDVDGDALSVLLVSGPTHGSLTLNADGSFTYTPNANYNGADSFSYKANDGLLDSNIVEVSLTITPVNDAPAAVADNFVTAEDVPLTIAASGVLVNDTDVEGDVLSAILVSGPAHGALTLNADGSFTYTPNANYNGTDSFSYKANDGVANSNLATVSLTITPVNDAPVATNDAYQTKQDVALTVSVASGVLSNDHDVDGDPLTAILSAGPAHGTLVLNADGSFAYTPNAGFFGTDSFTYRASDNSLTSNLVTVTLTVNAAPVTGGTKFLVVDGTARDTFNYDAAGNLVIDHKLNQENEAPRGIATNKDGSLYWVVDSKGEVFVYSAAGKLIGNWEAKGMDKPEGVATNGKDLWIVDRETDRVYFFAGGASRLTGKVIPTSSFALSKTNLDPMDITTDGAHLWVVNDTASIDKVFRYSLSGALEGSWQMDASNSKPTGLTIDPNDVDHIWVVDAGTDRVYQYSGAVSRTTGQQSAASSFALNSADSNPQGIADPKMAQVTSKGESSPVSVLAFDQVHTKGSDLHSSAKSKPISGTTSSLKERTSVPTRKHVEDAWDAAIQSLSTEQDHGSTSKVSEDSLLHLAKSRGQRRGK